MIGGMSWKVDRVEGTNIHPHREGAYAFYTNGTFRAVEAPLDLEVGLRYNHHSEFEGVVNPQLKLNLRPPLPRAKFSLSISNNIPSFTERYYQSTFIKGNPDLKMERAMNFVLSFPIHPFGSLKGDISGFLSLIRDRITGVKGDDGIVRYRNIGSASRKGVELAWGWRPTRSFSSTLSYTYLIARDETTGRYLPYSPKHRANLNFYFKGSRGWTLTLNTRYVGKRFSKTDNTESLSGYYLTDLRLARHWENLILYGEIKNLFDQDYEVLHGYPGPGRACRIGAEWGG